MSENLAQTSCVATEEGPASQSQTCPITVCTINCNFGIIGQTKMSHIFQLSLPQSSHILLVSKELSLLLIRDNYM